MRDRMAFPPRYAGMEGLPLSTALSAMCFPRATRGWKDKMIIFDSKGDVSPALRGDGSSAVVVHGFEHLFPPRYAGMEVPRSPIRRTPYGFPRATRGWKGSIGISGDAVNVSPALRGDGRASEAAKRSSLAFPPRYAGMEESHSCSLSSGFRFPRATRGWKVRVLGSIDRHCVSPALRGDGRVTASKISATTKFPPRYAGMEVNRVGRIGFEFRFPRATRGWKDLRRV